MAVIQMLLTMLMSRPCRKNLPVAYRATQKAQMIKIASQNSGSIFDGMTYTVAKPIARPNNDKRRINFQFISRLRDQVILVAAILVRERARINSTTPSLY